MFFFQMSRLPEWVISLQDYSFFNQIFRQLMKREESEKTFTDQDLEAFKYTFSQPGKRKKKWHLTLRLDLKIAIFFYFYF